MTHQEQAVRMLVTAVVDAVKEAGSMGAPGGVLYAALMAHGCTLEQFNILMDALVHRGMLRRSGHLYFATEEYVREA